MAQAADRSDPQAMTAVDRYLRHFGRVIATLVDVIDADAIVLGGSLSKVERLHSDGPASAADFVFSDDLRPPIVPAKFGDACGVRGAAGLW